MPHAAESTEIAPGRAPVLHEALAGLELAQLLTSDVFRSRPDTAVLPPVLVVPGFLAPDASLAPMVGWLRRAGARTYVPRIGVNLRCGEVAVTRMAERLEAIVTARGTRAVVVGHSRGGQLTRVLAVRRPDLVAAAVTLGTPGTVDRSTIHPVLRASSLALGALSVAGVPGLFGPTCFTGACCERFREDLARPVPAGVELTCVVGDHDGLADRRSCAGPPGARVVRVRASHIGMVANPRSFEAIDEALRRVALSG